MRRRFPFLFLTLILLLPTLCLPALAATALSARHAVLIDGNTGEVL